MRAKYRNRLAFRSIALVSLIALGGMYTVMGPSSGTAAPTADVAWTPWESAQVPSEDSKSSSRKLLSESRCTAPKGITQTPTTTTPDGNTTTPSTTTNFVPEVEEAFPNKLEPGTEWLIVILVPVIMYTFLALAIICDEYFVPALEVMVDEDNLNLSADVAGATFMAAGGSAPELFTSFIGTMQESSVGFGTIVGSAVFNVLFVIAMCAFFSKAIPPIHYPYSELLTLTWWPLARDCTYYTFSLIILGLFFKFISEGEIEWWEALILFLMYGGYVVLMMYNEKLYFALGFGGEESEGEESAEKGGDDPTKGKGGKDGCRTAHFRVGIVNLVLSHSEQSLKDKAAMHVIANIEGDALTTFNRLASNGGTEDEGIQACDLKVLFEQMEIHTSDEQVADLYSDLYSYFFKTVEEVRKELDLNGDGVICWEEFRQWYNTSEDRVREEMCRAFDKIASVSVMEDPNAIDMVGLRAVLKEIGGMKELEEEEFEKQLEAAMEEIDVNEDGLIQRDEFYKWYEGSMFWKMKNQDIGAVGIVPNGDEEGEEGEDEDETDPLVWPADGDCGVKTFWIIAAPLNFILAYTVPNCSQDYEVCGTHVKKLCYWGFFLSIVWIGIFSWIMVVCAERVGDTIGIPAQVMGLTFLAAGTSVPDLLSSIVVAQQGEGDMAVSSSIGSNIFDVLVGLPLPWLAYNAIMQQSVCVGAKSLQVSIFILVGMLVCVVAIIKCSGWVLSPALGGAMLVLYFLFVIQDLLRDEQLICTGGCF